MSPSAYANASFYVVAHNDDWQLFMMPNAASDVADPHRRAVFIQVTAGDNGLVPPYWLAREQGAIGSLRYRLAQADSGYFVPPNESTGTRAFNGHDIRFWASRNVTAYCLRLPDGNVDGEGFPLYRRQSLKRLEQKAIPSLAAVDGSTTYAGWQDLAATVAAIVRQEAEGFGDVRLNCHDPDTERNPRDHPDHIMTGRLVQAMPLDLPVTRLLYLGYAVSGYPADIALGDLYWKASLYAVYESIMHGLVGHADGSPIYQQYCLRTARYETVPPPST